MGHHDRAEDITQEVFIKLYKSISKYNTRQRFFTYLYKITVNTCFDHLKKNKNTQAESINAEKEHLINMTDELRGNPHRNMEQKELERVIRQLVQRLGPQQRTAFVLRDVEGLDTSEITEILKCSRITVRSHLHFARKSLREMIETEYPELKES